MTPDEATDSLKLTHAALTQIKSNAQWGIRNAINNPVELTKVLQEIHAFAARTLRAIPNPSGEESGQ